MRCGTVIVCSAVLASCAVSASGGVMYFGGGYNTGRVDRVNLNGTDLQTVVNTNPPEDPHDIAIDPFAGKVYWSTNPDFPTRESRIYRANVDGTAVENIVLAGNRLSANIAVDPFLGKLFWTDPAERVPLQTHRIMLSNLDGSSPETLIEPLAQRPGEIAVDVLHQYIYWASFTSDGSSQATIFRADYEGTDVHEVITGTFVAGFGLAVDPYAGKLYWSRGFNDAITGIVQRANLDGSNVETLLQELPLFDSPSWLALDLVNRQGYLNGEMRFDLDDPNRQIEFLPFGGVPFALDVSFLIPEPSSLALMGLGALALAALALRGRWPTRISH